MPDFNKGDFTQQGVNGHVNATVRLNEKRLLNIDLTSNEDAEGCTITGTVKDLLNEKVYNIGSGGGGGDNPLNQCHKCVLTLTNGDSQDIGAGLLINTLARLALIKITVTDGKLDMNNSFIDDNTIPSLNIAPGDSMTFNLYYVVPDNPGDPNGIIFNTQQFTFDFSDISNMKVIDMPEVTGYLVTDTDNDSALTVTATITVQ